MSLFRILTAALFMAAITAVAMSVADAQSKVTQVGRRLSPAAIEAWPGTGASAPRTQPGFGQVRLANNSEPGRLPPATDLDARPSSPSSLGRLQISKRSAAATETGSLPLLTGDDGPALQTGPSLGPAGRTLKLKDYSQIYIAAVKPNEIKVHDILTIIVDEKSEVIMNQRFNRQRNSKLKAELKDFVRLGETGNLVNAAANSPAIDGQINSGLSGTGTITDSEGIKYRIAAKVKDVKPNGTITLEAKKEIQTQDDASEYLLTGEIRAQDIKPDNTASSEDIANLTIVKRSKGRVYDSTKRGWGVRIFDALSPF